MNWRIPVVFVMVLAVFGAFAWFYYRGYVHKRSHGIVLFVANGLDLSVLSEARLQTQAARSRAILKKVPPGQLMESAAEQALLRDHIFQIETFPSLGVMNVRGPGMPVPDVGAASTALAGGQRVRNGLVGCNALNRQTDTLIYAAQRSGRATGLVTTSSLTAPTPVAFYTHMREGDDRQRVAADLVDSAHIDVVLGGGERFFAPAHITNERGRGDKRNLLEELEKTGYSVVSDETGLKAVPTWRTRQLFGVFAEDWFSYITAPDRGTGQPRLSEMVRVAIECLQYNINGYFLVVEHGLIGEACRNNFDQLSLDETKALDEAIDTAISYAGENALILVTNNVSYGALAPSTPLQLPAGSFAATEAKADKETPEKIILPTAPQWLTGPGGPRVTKEDEAWFKAMVARRAFSAEPDSLYTPSPAARFATESSTTSEPAWLGARGLGCGVFDGFYSNVDVYPMLQQKFAE